MSAPLDLEALRLASRIYSNLAGIQAAIRAETTGLLETAGQPLSAIEYAVLRLIAPAPSGVAIAGLSEYLSIPRTSARRIVDRLAREGLATSRQEQADRRVRRWAATDQGREALAAVPDPGADSSLARSLRGLTTEDRTVIADQLAALLRGLRASAAQVAGPLAIEEPFELSAHDLDEPSTFFDLWLAISRAYRLIRAEQTRFLANATDNALETANYMALYRVHETPASASEVAAFLRVDQNTAMRIIDRLEANRLISRERNPVDRRQVVISPTSKGVSLLAAVPPFDPTGGFIRRMRGLPDGGQQLAASLERLVGGFLERPIVDFRAFDEFLQRLSAHADQQREPLVERDAFRAAMSQFVTGVAVVTIGGAGWRRGITVNSLTSVSLDPPMLLVCFDRRSPSLERLKQVKTFAANVLGVEQLPLAERFGQRESEANSHALDDGTWTELDGVPVLLGSLVAIVCDVEDTFEAGTHTIVLAAPRQLAVGQDRGQAAGALGYWRSRYLPVPAESLPVDGATQGEKTEPLVEETPWQPQHKTSRIA